MCLNDVSYNLLYSVFLDDKIITICKLRIDKSIAKIPNIFLFFNIIFLLTFKHTTSLLKWIIYLKNLNTNGIILQHIYHKKVFMNNVIFLGILKN